MPSLGHDNSTPTPSPAIPSNLNHRRQMLGLCAGVAAAVALPDSRRARGEEPVSTPQKGGGQLLVRSSELPELNARTKIVIELEGKLQLRSTTEERAEPREAEVRAKSTLDYFEKSAFENSELVAAARRYVEASGENWIAGSAASQELRPECRQTRLMKHAGIWQQFCEGETLDLRESQLIHAPINSSVLELLLPEEPVKPDSSWALTAAEVASLFNLEAVHSTSLTARIAKVQSGVATMELEGDVQATANSVPTKLSIKGNYRAAFSRQSVIITWLGLAIRENREISQAEPGFAVTARVRLIRVETDDEFTITDEQLRDLAAKDDPGRWLVRIQSTAGRFSMLGDRRWKTYMDSGEETILRLIENDTVIAQCNLSRLINLDEGSQLTLEGMQADVKKSLGDHFESFLESQEKVTSSQLRLMRCVVQGSAEDVPLQWIYNHLSDDSGRRFALIYTMGGNLTDKFAAADEQMTSSFEFLPEVEPTQKPTSAPAIERSAKLENEDSGVIK